MWKTGNWGADADGRQNQTPPAGDRSLDLNSALMNKQAHERLISGAFHPWVFQLLLEVDFEPRDHAIAKV